MADASFIRGGLVVVLLMAIGSVQAEDLTLQNGRVLKDATIKSETAKKVVIIYAEGMTSVDKKLLPDALRRQYPELPEAVVARMPPERAQPKSNEVGKSIKKRSDAADEDDGTGDERRNEPSKKTEAEIRWFVRKDAAYQAERYFDQQQQGSSDYKMCRVQIDNMQPVEGETNVWIVSGRATMYRKSYHTVERDTSPIGDAGWRNRQNGTTYQPDYAPAESKAFEGRYTFNREENTTNLEITRQ